MRSPKQIAASRANGAKSRGPVTPDGKARVAENAIKHGLTARAVVLTNESKERFQDLLDAFLARFLPVGDVEFLLVERMAVAEWRLRRFWSYETALQDLEMDRNDAAIEQEFQSIDLTTRGAIAYRNLADNSHALRNIQQHQSRLERSWSRARQELEASRPPAPPPKYKIAKTNPSRPRPRPALPPSSSSRNPPRTRRRTPKTYPPSPEIPCPGPLTST